jgi:hypothetical protein
MAGGKATPTCPQPRCMLSILTCNFKASCKPVTVSHIPQHSRRLFLTCAKQPGRVSCFSMVRYWSAWSSVSRRTGAAWYRVFFENFLVNAYGETENGVKHRLLHAMPALPAQCFRQGQHCS